jgi:hypothetical protein
MVLPRFMYTDRTLWKNEKNGSSKNAVTLPRLKRTIRDKVPRVPLLEKEHKELAESLANAEKARADAEARTVELEAELKRELGRVTGETRALTKEKNRLQWTLRQGFAVWGGFPLAQGDDENFDSFAPVLPGNIG